MRRHAASAALVLLIGISTSCGGRSELLGGPHSCGSSGQTRACADACGAGLQRCDGTDWGTCEVPPISRSCTDACGDGVEECRDGAWQACVVVDSSAPCTTSCGSGYSRCQGGVWSGCEVPVITRECSTVCGFGTESCRDGVWQNCDAPQPRPPELSVTIRDFDDTHPDFERGVPSMVDVPGGIDRHIVRDELGVDDKPVYLNSPCNAKGCTNSTVTTAGESSFNEWYNDVPGVNLSTKFDLDLLPQQEPGEPVLFTYDNHAFFPIDGQLLGNDGRSHNYHFTLEAHTVFTYAGGEVFTFSGDDDMWVFVNRRLAINLGGIHESKTASVQLDPVAPAFGLELGGTYPIHFFFAERQAPASNFTIRTSIAEASSCD